MQKFYAEINKIDDEQRLVWGYASTEALDQQKEVVKREAIVDALDDYMAFGNIREMHQPSAVGVAKSATIDEKGMLLCAKVVDDAAWAKVKEGVYKGFSIGGRAISKVGGVISKMRLMEISLVDRPANPECTISMFKRDDSMTVPAYINKGMYNVAELATIIERLGNLRAWVLSEGEWEGGDAADIAQAAALSASITGLVELLSAMVTEEGAEITAAATIGDIAKVGDDVIKADLGDNIAKILDAMQITITKALEKQRDEFEAKLSALAAEPMPLKGVVGATTVVTKADDVSTGAQNTALELEFAPFQKAMLAGDTETATREQIKLIHKFAPRRLI